METKNHHNVSAGELCEVDAGNGIVVELFRSAKYFGPREGMTGFRPSKVIKNGTTIWDFKNSGAKIEMGQAAEIVEYGAEENWELVIATCDRRRLFSVFPVSDFRNGVMVMLKGQPTIVGGSSPEQLLDLKISLSRELGLEYTTTPEEQTILNRRAEAEREKREATRRDDQSKKEAENRERMLRVSNIMNRERAEAWDTGGKHYFGIPIYSDDEWKCLPNGKYCIRMESDQPVEAFIVQKTNSVVKKTHPIEVSGAKPEVSKTASFPEALDQIVVSLRNETRPVLVFSSMADIRTLQLSGLNSGTWVGCRNAIGETSILEVTEKEIKTIGVSRPKAQSLAD